MRPLNPSNFIERIPLNGKPMCHPDALKQTKTKPIDDTRSMNNKTVIYDYFFGIKSLGIFMDNDIPKYNFEISFTYKYNTLIIIKKEFNVEECISTYSDLYKFCINFDINGNIYHINGGLQIMYDINGINGDKYINIYINNKIGNPEYFGKHKILPIYGMFFRGRDISLCCDENHNQMYMKPFELPEIITPVIVPEIVAHVIVPEIVAHVIVDEIVEPVIVPEIVAPVIVDEIVAHVIVDEIITHAIVDEIVAHVIVPEIVAPVIVTPVIVTPKKSYSEKLLAMLNIPQQNNNIIKEVSSNEILNDISTDNQKELYSKMVLSDLTIQYENNELLRQNIDRNLHFRNNISKPKPINTNTITHKNMFIPDDEKNKVINTLKRSIDNMISSEDQSYINIADIVNINKYIGLFKNNKSVIFSALCKYIKDKQYYCVISFNDNIIDDMQYFVCKMDYYYDLFVQIFEIKYKSIINDLSNKHSKYCISCPFSEIESFTPFRKYDYFYSKIMEYIEKYNETVNDNILINEIDGELCFVY